MLDKFRFKRKKGFTLIELIVVIAVLGVLVLIGSPKIIGYVQKAELTRIQHDTKVMENKVAEVLNEDGSALFQWDDNAKDLGSLILKSQLYEKEGRASRVNKAHLIRSTEVAVNENGRVESQLLGIGGENIPINEDVSTEDSNGDGYKIIPEVLKKEIGTKLSGTFYSNELGKVYYEPNKPLKSIKNEQVLACVTPESLDYEFSIKNGKGTITKYNGTLTHLYIPGAFLLNIDGVEKCVPVQVIGSGAFRRGPFNAIEFPQSVVEIEDGAFEDGKLTEVYIPHSVKTIGQNAFAGNPFKSDGVTVGSSADSVNLGSGAFGTTTPSYQIPTASGLQIVVGTKVNSSGVKTGRIESYYGSDLTDSSSGSTNGSGPSQVTSSNQNKVVTIPSKVVVNGETIVITEIAKGAYQGQGIIYVGFPESLEIIEDYAFAGNQLVGVEIPEKVWSVGNYAFAFNEIEGERTMGYVDILNTDYVPQISDKTGNIELIIGTKTAKVGNTNLFDHVFVTSKGGFSVPETYVPVSKTNFFDVPSKPVISSIDNVSAVVTGVEGTEVKLDDGEWQTSPHKFTGLTEGKVYKAYSRFKETDKYFASKVSEVTEFEVEVALPWSDTFTNAGATGRFGPTQEQIASAYIGTSLEGEVVSNAGIQTWIVPKSGTYRIEAYGAQGGNGIIDKSVGGLGAIMSGEFNLEKETTLKILVGQKGNDEHYAPGGGASGTWISNSKVPMVIAGAGGGANSVKSVISGKNATISSDGISSYGDRGTNGSGGKSGGQTGGGGGWNSNGGNGRSLGGQALKSGAQGGKGHEPRYDGSFGGGGGGYGGGGGGGGYSGGGGGEYTSYAVEAPGGGGGSYNSGANQENSVGNTGHGKVIITLIGK